MRFPFFLLVLLLAGKMVFAQTLPSSCIPSSQLLQSYKNDVADLALQRLYEIGSPDTALIEIPQHYQDTIWKALAAVANTGAVLEGDSIFRNYCVHHWPGKSYQGYTFDLEVDTNYAWAKQWYLGNTFTGDPAIDSFMARHSVYLVRYTRNSPIEFLNNRADLYIRRVINMRAFADSMMRFPGTVAIYIQGSAGDYGDIKYSVDTKVRLAFKAAWGDCPAGCTAWKIWHYSVNLQTCAVTLDSIDKRWANYLDVLYMPNCNGWPVSVAPVLPANTESLTLFPNPAIATLQLQGLAGGTATYRISDIAGRALLEGVMVTHQINIAPLPAGFYLLTVWGSTGGIHTRRFVKE